jgi:aminocarboxymuconate-semialdehyde decarboxylase
MTVIDVHNHFLPAEVVADARRGNGFDGITVEDGWVVHRQGYRYPLHPAFSDVGKRLAAMDAVGIDQAILSIAPQMFMYGAADGAADFARSCNDALAAAAWSADGRLTPVASLPMADPGAAANELRRAVGRLNMRGAMIGPLVEGAALDDPAFDPVLACADELGVPLILHPYYVGTAEPPLDDFYLTNLVGNPLATTVCAARLILSGTLDAHPGLRIVLVHAGGFLPFQIGRLDHGHRVRPEARACALDPSQYLRRFWFDTITHAAVPLRFLVDLVGADRVVFGTDFPFDMAAGSPGEQLDGFSGRQREWIEGGNAAEVFGLTRRAE